MKKALKTVTEAILFGAGTYLGTLVMKKVVEEIQKKKEVKEIKIPVPEKEIKINA